MRRECVRDGRGDGCGSGAAGQGAGARGVAQSIGVRATGFPSGERRALLELYNSTNGAGWTSKTNWNGAAGTECTWFGVTCDNGGTTVQYLGLSNNNLVGTLPATLSGLTNLQFFYLSTNHLTGSIPTQLGGLANLVDLGLEGNQLTGSIPVEFGNLPNLRELSLDGNRLTGSIPTVLGSLTNLVALNLSGNQLTGPIPSEVGNLTNLQYLYLNGNMLSGAVPTSLEGLTQLVAGQSDLSYNALYSTDATLTGFLNGKQVGGNWQSTQTVAPTSVAAGATTNTSVALSWTPIAYTGDTGGYQTLYSTTSGGPYTTGDTTADKGASSIVVSGLNPATLYYFVVRTVTNPNANNTNTVTSDPSAELYATTSGGVCTSPLITSQPESTTIHSGQTTTLSVAATGSAPLSHHWYQGASADTSHPTGTNASSFTTPALTTTSYWVQVNNSGGQADSATVTVTSTYAVWVPVASRNPGKNQSQWRSDLGLLNPGAVAASAQITFYGSDGVREGPIQGFGGGARVR